MGGVTMTNNMIKSQGRLIMSALTLIPMIALADKLDVKTGLWESTTITEIGGMAMPSMPPEVLAKMPPEQRAQMEAMMNRGSGNPVTSQSCVTEKDLERGLRPEPTKEQSCKVDSISSSGKTQETHVTCTTSRGKSTGVFKMTATSRESYEGTMDMNTAANGRPMTIKMRLKGKWLGANCGNVKPIDG
jgi:hypothetical protein